MVVYLVYRYEGFDAGSTRHLDVGFRELNNAKAYVETAAHEDMEYRKSRLDRYLVNSPIRYEWVDRDDEFHYRWTMESKITLTGDWLGGWGRYAVVPFEIK